MSWRKEEAQTFQDVRIDKHMRRESTGEFYHAMTISISRSKVARTDAGATALDLLALGSVWVAMVLLVNPVGNFPLNDDWSYGRAVYSLVVDGDFQLTGFTAMPLIAQILWGALFCLFNGFSFTTLRISTLVLGFIGVVATYKMVKEVRASRSVALVAGMLIATNPLYFALSFTFMTDVPFVAASMVAFLFLLRGIRNKRTVELLLGSFFTCVALLIRQPALLIPVSFAVAYLFTRGITRKNILVTITPVVIAAGILVGYQFMLHMTIGVPALYNRGFDPIFESSTGIAQLVVHFLNRVFVAVLYLGLFLLPLTIIVTAYRWGGASHTKRRSFVLTTLVLFGATLGGLLWTDRIMPLWGNILFDVGLGPALLRDVYVLELPHFPRAPRIFWLVITIASAVGGVLLVQNVGLVGFHIVKKTMTRERVDNVFPATLTLTACMLYLALIAVTGYLDRYLLFVLPLFIVGMTAKGLRTSQLAAGTAGLLLFTYGLFSVGATHDYLSWNRARWNALHHLMEDLNVSYHNIDGGFEFNGWYYYDPAYQQLPGKSWWIHNDEYVLSFGPLAGYKPVERHSYQQWIPFRTGNILVLRRIAKHERLTVK